MDSFQFHLPPGKNEASSSLSSSPSPEPLAFATFQSNPLHTNGVGTLHGGMQAILLEQAVLEQLTLDHDRENGSSTSPPHIVDTMSIEYLSVAKTNDLHIPIEPLLIGKGRDDRIFKAKVLSKSRICCQGELRVVPNPLS